MNAKCWTHRLCLLYSLVLFHVTIYLVSDQKLYSAINAAGYGYASPEPGMEPSTATSDTPLCSSIVQHSNSSILNDNILFCHKEYSNIISAFGMYCNDLSLYWFHRLISSQTLLSVTVPKHIFMYIHNMANSTMCNGYNAHKRLYYSFADYITAYFNGKLTIHLYFADEMHSTAYWRNFVTQKVNEYIINHVEEGKQLSNRFSGHIVIQFFDADDIVHPQKLQLMDLVYSSIPINGTVLHAFRFRPCRNYFGPLAEANYSLFFEAVANESTKTAFDYRLAQSFHTSQMQLLLSTLQFERFDAQSIVSNLSMLLFSSNKQTLSERHLSPLLKLNSMWRIARAVFDARIDIAQGWPTTTLSALLANPFNSQYSRGQDQIFNIDTINAGYDFYLFALELGLYCQGDVAIKLAFDGD